MSFNLQLTNIYFFLCFIFLLFKQFCFLFLLLSPIITLMSVDALSREKVSNKKKAIIVIVSLSFITLLLFILSFFVGYSSLSFSEVIGGLFGQGSDIAIRVVQRVRLPRTLAALLIGGGLAISGLIMQTCLKNPMASPTTLGVSNAATLGANIAIILASGTGANFVMVAANPEMVSLCAFIMALLCVGTVLLISSFRRFSPTTVVLVGIALSSLFQAITTLIQYFADDVQLATVINWSFGNLERMTMKENLIASIVIIISFVIFLALSWRFNALLGGENMARNMGVRTTSLRFVGLFLASLIAAICVCFVGIIGFIGIIAPHICKRILGNDHRILIPASLLTGSSLLLLCDIATRLIGNGVSLPVGAITSIIGVPFFILIIAFRKEKHQ